MADDVPVASQLYPPTTALTALTPFEAYRGGQLPSYMVHPADSLDFPAMWRSYVPPGMARVPGSDYNADQNDRAISRAAAGESFLDRTKRLLGFPGSAPAAGVAGSGAPAATLFPVMRGVVSGAMPAGYTPPKVAPLAERMGMVPAKTAPLPMTVGVRG